MRYPRVIPLISTGLLCAFTAPAGAQVTQQLEIDFTSATLPLSPLLTVLVALAVGALGLYALRKTRGRARLVSWLVIGLAALPIAMESAHLRLIGAAQAIPAATVALTTSPAIVTVSPTVPLYIATNVTNTNVTITGVRIVGTGGFALDVADTTCVVGLSLPPGAKCYVYLTGL